MPKKPGRLMLLRIGDGATPTEAFTLVGGLQNINGDFGANLADVTTRGDTDANGVLWQSFIATVNSGTVSGDGFSEGLTEIQLLWDTWVGQLMKNYQLVIPNLGTITAPMYIGDFNHTGPYDGGQGFSVTLALAGPPSIVKET